MEPVSPEGPACILFSKTTRRQTSTKETHDTRPRQDTRPQRRRSKRENGKAQQCFVKKIEVKSSSYSPQKYKKSATLRLPLPLPLSIINDDERKTKQVKAQGQGRGPCGLRFTLVYELQRSPGNLFGIICAESEPPALFLPFCVQMGGVWSINHMLCYRLLLLLLAAASSFLMNSTGLVAVILFVMAAPMALSTMPPGFI